MSSGFFAHKGNVNQTGVPSNTYTQVSFATVKFNNGNCFNPATGLWTPPAGLIQISGQLWINAGAGGVGNPSFVAKVMKNAALTDVFTGIGAPGGVAGTAAIPFSGWDVANGSDYYQVQLYASSATTSTIDGNPAHTFISGAALNSEKPPNPLPPTARRYDEKGRPTADQVQYEAAFGAYLRRMAASLG